MRAPLVHSLVALAGLLGAGCSNNGVGRKCIIPNPDAGIPGGGSQFSTPALECPTRICLIQGDQSGAFTRSTCTAQCETDSDCANAVLSDPGSDKRDPLLCPTHYKCTVVNTVGSYKCKKFCVCHDDLVCGMTSDADGGAITPAGCENPTTPPPSC